MSVDKALNMIDDLVQIIDTDHIDQKQTEEYVMGLDCSTQSLTISVYNTSNFIEIDSVNINFEKEFDNKYGTTRGFIQNGLEVTAPTLMFIEALDIALNKLHSNNFIDFSKIIALSGSGQQHGSVYWNKSGNNIQLLSNLDVSKSLLNNFANSFAIQNGAIWMDSSTTKQCRDLEFKVGSAAKVASISGSIAYERFTGNQIAKIFTEKHDIYSELCERISLISSFMCSIFIGSYASIDCSDGSGMNLLDINTRKWSNILLESTAVGLRTKLGEKVVNSYDCCSCINKYFVNKYGFNSNCSIISFSGDNPCSLAGLMCYSSGDICISLGTSDTVFAVTKTPKPSEYGHVLCSPIHSDAFMILLCYKNGSIARERIRDKYNCQTWNEFNKRLLNTTAGNEGRLAFYYDQAEILPTIKAGFYRYDEKDNCVDNYIDNEYDIRGIIESQFLAMRQHLIQIGVQNPSKILATGGASQNKVLLQILSDVFGITVYLSESGADTATKGAALRALHGYKCKIQKKFIPFSNIINDIGGPKYIKIAEPNLNNTKIYTKLLSRRKALEDKLPRLSK